MVLHLQLLDGTSEHVPFTRDAWESALRDTRLSARWSHDPEDCHNPAERLWANRRPAVQGDPAAGGEHEAILLVEEPIVYPPSKGDLTMAMLRQLTTLGECDAAMALSHWRYVEETGDKGPLLDHGGQFKLF